MIDSKESAVLCSNSEIKNIMTMHEKWYEPSVNDLRQAMRKAYRLSNEQKQQYISNFNKEIFSYDHMSGIVA
jgi:hypothetical protein